jgi:hypothetical protein
MVDNNMSLTAKASVLAHERRERDAMAKGHPYWRAHRMALRKE